MCPFSSVAAAGPSAGAAILPYCFAPAAAATFPAGACVGSSTAARSSSVIFSVGLSSLFAIVSFGRVGLLLLWRGRSLLRNRRWSRGPILFKRNRKVRLQ